MLRTILTLKDQTVNSSQLTVQQLIGRYKPLPPGVITTSDRADWNSNEEAGSICYYPVTVHEVSTDIFTSAFEKEAGRQADHC